MALSRAGRRRRKRRHSAFALTPGKSSSAIHDGRGVTFHYKDYRTDAARRKVMTLATDEFIRRFLLHILPKGFHRIRHYGLFANTGRAENIARLRELLGPPAAPAEKAASPSQHEPAETVLPPCPCCGGRMEIGTADRIPLYIKRAKDKKDKFQLTGFGHRVYKTYDPRARIMS